MAGWGDFYRGADFWCGSFHQASAWTRTGGGVDGGLSGMGTIGALGRNRPSLEIGGADFDRTYFGASGFESADVGGSDRFACGLGGGSALGGECLACSSSGGGGMVGAFVRGGTFAFSSSVGGSVFPLGASHSCNFGLRRFGVLFSRLADRPGRGFGWSLRFAPGVLILLHVMPPGNFCAATVRVGTGLYRGCGRHIVRSGR